MYTLPWGFLSAVLLVFGRLSSHQEITSFRVAGLSLVRLAAPVFVIGFLLSLGSLWLNVSIIPRSKASSVQLLYEQASRDPDSLLKPGVVQGNFEGSGNDVQKVLIEGRSGEWVEGFNFYQLPDSDEDERTYIHAARAALAVDKVKSQLRVKLENAYFETRSADNRIEMAFAAEAEPLLIDLKSPKSQRLQAGTMTNMEIHDAVYTPNLLSPSKKLKLQLEVAKRYSFSMACLAFAFIAVPLGLGSRRQDTSSGLVISLLIGTGYFLVTMFAEQFHNQAQAIAMVWVPNILCILLGLVLFRRARFK
jgi:lipopolysaccharide export system permease protein